MNYLARWFRKKKNQHISLHISWSYRGKEDQEKAFSEGKTRAHFPKSAHNRVNPSTLEPESAALDLFEITPEGKAIFSPTFYARLADEAKKDGDEIIWGGNFKSIGDSDHFQYHQAI